MKIEGGNLLLSSQHGLVETNSRKESLRMWVGSRRPDFEQRASTVPSPRAAPDAVVISEAGKAAAAEKSREDDPAQGDARLQLLIALVERMTGRKIKVVSVSDLTGQSSSASAATVLKDPHQAASAPPPAAGFGVEYDRHESHYEAEQTRFAAAGVVRTADGKEIRFTVQLDMSREFSQQTDVSLRLGDAARRSKDPLVINFSGSAAELTDRKFSFDLDADGAKESISFVGAGSGFLAIDHNRDGKIDDGSELLGPSTGDGFAELASYDSDRNGWIDENDAVYQDLRVWSKDAEGRDSLATLKEAKVGAIALANVATEFSVRDSRNAQQGQVRATGIYLTEAGSAGTVQHVDLAI